MTGLVGTGWDAQLLDAGPPDAEPLGQHRPAHSGPVGGDPRLDLGQALLQGLRPVRLLSGGGTGRNFADRRMQSLFHRRTHGDDLLRGFRRIRGTMSAFGPSRESGGQRRERVRRQSTSGCGCE
ncbi:hypothetical protein AB0K52_12655 [Glycomyces sp. NPDC049804]|uniref:hypothetical protein n=1 Tax=Glycomyces sp. NPDC049804 TaxID=3154363 RepID=UPI003448B0A7